MRIAPLAQHFAAIAGCFLLLSGVALADGGQREAPIEQIERPAPEVIEDVPPTPPAEEAEKPNEIAHAMGRSLTACEQLRIDIHDLQRHYYHQRRDDRRAAYIGMRNGDQAARYICIGTTCTPKRHDVLYQRAMRWDTKNVNLQDRIANGHLGVSDDCSIWHQSMMEQLFAGTRWHHGKHFKHRKHDGPREGQQTNAPEDRRDPFEIEMESRYQRARRTRGY